MNVYLIRKENLERVRYSAGAIIVHITDPEEDIDEELFERIDAQMEPGQVGSALQCILEFSSFTPDLTKPGDDEENFDENACSLDTITCALEIIEDEDITDIYICGDDERAAGIALGLQAALNIDSDINDILYNFVSEAPQLIPHHWVIGLFDYMLQLEGRLITALDDYTSTGLVINSTGRVATGTWST
jgi:hypothetical protein